jgi:predicted dehydrogenase
VAAFCTLTSMRGQRRSVTGYELEPHMGGGVFHDKVVHVVDVLRFLFDCEVAIAEATCAPAARTHEFASLNLRMENGVHVAGVSADQMFPDFTCLVLGDAGKAMINLTRPTGLLLYRKTFARDRLRRMSGYARQLLHIAGTMSYFATARGRLSSYRAEWETFIHGVSTRIPPRPNFDDGVAVTRTLQQLLVSAGMG